MVILILIGALKTTFNVLVKGLEDVEIRGQEKTVILTPKKKTSANAGGVSSWCNG